MIKIVLAFKFEDLNSRLCQIYRAPLTGGVAKRSAKISNNTYKLFFNQNNCYDSPENSFNDYKLLDRKSDDTSFFILARKIIIFEEGLTNLACN